MLDDLEMQSRFGGVTQEVGGVPGFERHPCDFSIYRLGFRLTPMPQKYIRSSESCHSSTNFKDKQLITERISEKRSSVSVKKHTIRRNQNPDPSQPPAAISI